MSSAIETIKLPSGWAWTTLGAVCEPYIEQIGPKKPHFTYIDISSIDSDTKCITNPKSLLAENAPGRARQNVHTSDLLISLVRPNLNAVALVPSDLDDAVASTGFIVLRPRSNVSSAWLLLIVKSEQFVNEMMKLVRGAFPTIRANQVRAFRIPLPPFAEQLRIVSRHEELNIQSRQARAHLSKVPAQLTRTRQSILTSAFSGTGWSRKKRGSSWQNVSLSKIIADLQQGWSPRCENFPALPNQWGVIKTTAIQPMSFLDAENKAFPSYFQPNPSLEITTGDILITRKGPRARAGVTAYVSQTRNKLMVCDTAFRLRVDSTMCEARFLAYLLNSPAMMEKIDKLKSGVSDSGVGFTQSGFLSLTVNLPPLSEQREIIHQLDTALTQIDITTSVYDTLIADLNRLDHAILARALSGQLVKQEPTDEPANILLNQLLAETAIQPKNPRKRMKRKTKSPELHKIRSIMEVFHAENIEITPEDLFHKTGQDETDLEQVEKFYADLRQLVKKEKVKEIRPDSKTVLLSATP